MPVSLNGETPNEQLTVRRIERAVRRAAAASAAISSDTARLIASTIQEGTGSALGQFAATGQTRIPDAQRELCDTGPDDCPIEWWRALDHYFSSEVRRGAA